MTKFVRQSGGFKRPRRQALALSKAPTVASGVYSSDGIATVSGIGASSAAAVYASNGVAAVSGTASASSSASAAAAGTATVSGVGASSAASAYASDGVAIVSAEGAGAAAAAYGSAGIATVSGIGDSATAGAAVGEAAGSATVSGIGSSSAAGVGASTGSATAAWISDASGAARQPPSHGSRKKRGYGLRPMWPKIDEEYPLDPEGLAPEDAVETPAVDLATIEYRRATIRRSFDGLDKDISERAARLAAHNEQVRKRRNRAVALLLLSA